MAGDTAVVIRSNVFGPVRVAAPGMFGPGAGQGEGEGGIGATLARALQLEVTVETPLGTAPPIHPWGAPWAYGDVVAAAVLALVVYGVAKVAIKLARG